MSIYSNTKNQTAKNLSCGKAKVTSFLKIIQVFIFVWKTQEGCRSAFVFEVSQVVAVSKAALFCQKLHIKKGTISKMKISFFRSDFFFLFCSEQVVSTKVTLFTFPYWLLSLESRITEKSFKWPKQTMEGCAKTNNIKSKKKRKLCFSGKTIPVNLICYQNLHLLPDNRKSLRH